MAVQDDKVLVGEYATELDALARVLARYPLKILDERPSTTAGLCCTDIPSDSLAGVRPIES